MAEPSLEEIRRNLAEKRAEKARLEQKLLGMQQSTINAVPDTEPVAPLPPTKNAVPPEAPPETPVTKEGIQTARKYISFLKQNFEEGIGRAHDLDSFNVIFDILGEESNQFEKWLSTSNLGGGEKQQIVEEYYEMVRELRKKIAEKKKALVIPSVPPAEPPIAPDTTPPPAPTTPPGQTVGEINTDEAAHYFYIKKVDSLEELKRTAAEIQRTLEEHKIRRAALLKELEKIEAKQAGEENGAVTAEEKGLLLENMRAGEIMRKIRVGSQILYLGKIYEVGKFPDEKDDHYELRSPGKPGELHDTPSPSQLMGAFARGEAKLIPSSAEEIEQARADVERRRKEELANPEITEQDYMEAWKLTEAGWNEYERHEKESVMRQGRDRVIALFRYLRGEITDRELVEIPVFKDRIFVERLSEESLKNLIDEAKEKWQFLFDRINAKYDAELAALEAK